MNGLPPPERIPSSLEQIAPCSSKGNRARFWVFAGVEKEFASTKPSRSLKEKGAIARHRLPLPWWLHGNWASLTLLGIHGAKHQRGINPLSGIFQTPVEVGASGATRHANSANPHPSGNNLVFPDLDATFAIDHCALTIDHLNMPLHVTVDMLPAG